jgi:hypothetical protein
MNETKDSTFFGYHAVCLIDVLGQNDELVKWEKQEPSKELTPELLAALRKTAGTVLGFRDSFEKFFESLNDRPMPSRIATASMQLVNDWPRLAKCLVRVERFSDTFLFSSPIGNGMGEASVIPVFNLMAACCGAMFQSLAGKVPVRGAITIGQGAELEDQSFYGPALAEVHHLESKVAKYPRVVIAPRVLEFLAEGEVYSQNALFAKVMSAHAASCRDLICKDEDGLAMVDFLGHGVKRILGESPEVVLPVKLGYDFVRSERQRFYGENNNTLAERYRNLQGYIESRLAIWGLQPES